MRRILVAGIVVVAVACLGGVVAGSAHAYVPDGTQGWYWQMPQPAAGLADVTFADAGDAWAVGAGGVILHSTDAGQTWAAEQSGTVDDLDSVSFADAQHGWASGASTWDDPGQNVVLATTDGGETWVDRTPSGLTRTLTNVSFADDQNGWAGTTSGYAAHTTDAGLTWTTRRVGTAKGALAVDFVSASKGWATEDGDVVWRTTNGGATWSIVHRFNTQGFVDFTDSSHGWAALGTYGNESVSFSFLATSDGGVHWRVVRRIADAWISAFHTSSPLDAAFVGVVENGSTVSDSLADSYIVSATTDGGMSWTTRHIGGTLAPAAIAGRGSALCAVGEGIVASADAGGSWSAASSGQQYSLNDGVAVSSSDLWAVDDGGALLHSSDGRQWAEQPSPVRWSQELRALSFPDANDGWLVGATQSFSGGVILHTSDGGATWSPQASSLAGELVGVDFVDAANGWAISDDPWGSGNGGAMTAIERTTDGGASWLAQYVNGNPSLTAVDFVDATTGWAGGSASNGEAAVMYKTTDGGQSWATEALPKGLTGLSGLQFMDQNEGWAVGSSFPESSAPTPQGWLLHTTDGGATWAAVTTAPTGSFVDAVHFLDSQHGWLAGLGVWATTDGGATWAKVAGGAAAAIAATDATHVWAFGDGIVATLDGDGGDAAPPQTLDDADWAWHRRPVTIALSASDTGGSGVKDTQFSSDGGSTWQPGTAIAVPAPADTHANDGEHIFLYRSTDNAGNAEATEICGVGIDTVGPVCGAPKNATAGAGKSAIVRFKAADVTSGVAVATVRIETRAGRVVHTLVARSGDWSTDQAPAYLWLRFTCKLKPGLYRVVVRAVDRAGNLQTRTGRGWLRVVRSGAPKATPPFWPSGLPGEVTESGAPGNGALARPARAGLLGSPWGELPWQAGGGRLAVTGMGE